MGLFELLQETLRASDAANTLAKIGVSRLGSDDRYWREASYAFTLHDPTLPDALVFPLVLNPQSLKKSHPFAVELVPTQESGVIAEENGVLISDLTVSGHTGIRPRLNTKDGGPSAPLSGQAHFLWLQDACFLRYSDLKKDPKTADKTYMTWHNYKDGEHWVCVPRNITVDRNLSKNFYYNYSIQVSLIAEVVNQSKASTEDSALFVSMKDTIRNISRAVTEITSTVKDIENFESTVAGTVTAVLANVTSAVGYVSSFLTGQSNFIRFPLRAMQTLATDIDVVMRLVDPYNALAIPYDYTAAWLEIQDGILRLASYPEKYREDFSSAAQRLLALSRGPANASLADLDAASTTSITQASQLETSGLRPGDADRVRAGLFDLPVSFPRYLGFRETRLSFHDTLPSLAARELGDARRWIDIAIANGLLAPYISEEGLPGTLRPGQPILIPTTEANQSADTVRSAGDPELGASQLDALFGSDFEMAEQANGFFDFVVDPGTGTDLVTVRGLANIEQTITTILATTKGSYLLHLNVGVADIVGKKGTVDQVVEARTRVIEAVQRDPRVAKVRNASFRLDADVLEIGLDVDTINASPIRVIGRVTS